MNDKECATISQEEKKKFVERLQTVWFWFQGNGYAGAKDRITTLEETVAGKEDCFCMNKLKDHLAKHARTSEHGWDLTIGLMLVFVGQIASMIITVIAAKGGF